MCSAYRTVAFLAGLAALTSLVLYLVSDHVFNLYNVTCFGAFSRHSSLGSVRSKPFVEMQAALGVAYVFDHSSLVYEVTTPFQHIEVYQHYGVGNILVIDGSLQITTRDEAYYHEMMVHVPMAYLPNAKRVLIVGGGDGGALSRVAAYGHVTEMHLVDIDMYSVRDVSLRYFPQLYSAFLDPRTRAHASDGHGWIRERLRGASASDPFDLVIVDSTDYGSAETLFTEEFYADVKRLMHPRSIAIVNLDSPSWNLDIVSTVQRQLAGYFKYAFVYHAHQPTFLGGHYSYLFCSDAIHPMATLVDWGAWSKQRLTTYYYSPDLHHGAFALPAAVQRQVSMSAQLKDVPVGGFPSNRIPHDFWPDAPVEARRLSPLAPDALQEDDPAEL